MMQEAVEEDEITFPVDNFLDHGSRVGVKISGNLDEAFIIYDGNLIK